MAARLRRPSRTPPTPADPSKKGTIINRNATLRFTAAGALLTLTLGASACSVTESNDSSSDSAGSGKIKVTSSADACKVSADKAASGNLVFDVKNTGDKVTEFYLYGEDGLRIAGEVENIGPGLSRKLVVAAPQGKYVTACKPGMVGKGIRSDFRVTKSDKKVGVQGVNKSTIDQATTRYAGYVKDRAGVAVTETKKFTDAYKAGDDDLARKLYPQSRIPWEGIETVAESFGTLDPKVDLREADLEPGQKWTGWHRIEKDLWPPKTGYRPLSKTERATYADDLMKNINTLYSKVKNLKYTVDQIANGSKGLLDEVATGKITGEEDIWSHTDLYDFQANVDGARVGYETLQPLLQIKDPKLSKTIKQRFDALQKLLEKYREGKDGFVSYDTVGKAERKELSDAVNALSEPLSKMTGALTLWTPSRSGTDP